MSKGRAALWDLVVLFAKGPRKPPEFPAGDSGAFCHCFEFGPHDGGMDAAVKLLLREAAVGAGDHVFAADAFREAHETLGDQFGVLNDVRSVAHHARRQNFSFRQLHFFPHAPLMLVAGIRGLEQVGPGTHLQNKVHDFS